MGKEKYKIFEGLALVSQIGISMVTPILVGILAGNFLDRKLGTRNIFLFIFILLGIGSAFMYLYRIFLRNYKK